MPDFSFLQNINFNILNFSQEILQQQITGPSRSPGFGQSAQWTISQVQS